MDETLRLLGWLAQILTLWGGAGSKEVPGHVLERASGMDSVSTIHQVLWLLKSPFPSVTR